MAIVATKDTGWDLLVSKLEIKTTVEVDVLSSSIKRSIPKDWPIISGYENPLPLESVYNRRGFDSSNQCVDGWLSRIRHGLYVNPSVEDIFVTIEDSNVDVWVIIPERDLTVLDQLADIEWELLDIFVSGEHPVFLIDFHIIYRCGRNIEDLAPTKAIRLSRQVQ